MGLETDSEIIQHPDGRVELRDRSSIESSPLYNEDSRAGSRGEAQLDDLQLRGALDQHGALHSDLHARVGTDRGGDELAAGALHNPARQHHRAPFDPAQFAPRHEIWNSLPGLRAGQLRRDRIEPAGVDASACGLRLVRHSGWIGGEALHTLFKAIIPGWQTLLGGPVGGHLRPNGCRFCSSGG